MSRRGRGGSRSRFGSNRWWDNKDDGGSGGSGTGAQGTFYSILNVKSSASTVEIKAAYRKLALKYHPDMRQAGDSGSGNGIDEAAAEEVFRQITEAYDTLKNDSKRREYDQTVRYGAGVQTSTPQYDKWHREARRAPRYPGKWGDEQSTDPRMHMRTEQERQESAAREARRANAKHTITKEHLRFRRQALRAAQKAHAGETTPSATDNDNDSFRSKNTSDGSGGRRNFCTQAHTINASVRVCSRSHAMAMAAASRNSVGLATVNMLQQGSRRAGCLRWVQPAVSLSMHYFMISSAAAVDSSSYGLG